MKDGKSGAPGAIPDAHDNEGNYDGPNVPYKKASVKLGRREASSGGLNSHSDSFRVVGEVLASEKQLAEQFRQEFGARHPSEMEDEMPEQALEGLLYRQQVMMISGGAKRYKSWVLAQLIVCVATGADFLGFPVNKGKALYINLELFEAEAKNRLRLISKAMGFAKIPENNIDVVSFKGKKLTTAKLMKYAEGMRAAGYVLVVVDPIYKPYIGRDENSIEGVSGILHEFEVLAMAINASAVFAHHFSKGPQAYKEAMDRASGSGGFSRSPDTLLALTKNEAEKGITVEIDLRSFPPIKPFGIRHRFPIFERDDTIDPAKVVDREKKPRKHPDELMLIPLRVKPEGLRYTEWFKAINGGKKVISDSQFERRVKELKQEKKVVVGINKCYKEAEAVEVAQFVEGLGGDQS